MKIIFKYLNLQRNSNLGGKFLVSKVWRTIDSFGEEK